MSDYYYYFDCERMRHPKTGIYEFCAKLGNAIAAKLEKTEHLACYVPEIPEGTFDSRITLMPHRHFHKFLFPKLKQPAVWLSTYQRSSYLPRKKVPVIQTIHDLNFLHEDKSKVSIARNTATVQRNVDRASVVVAISNFVASEILKYQKIDKKKLHVIHNGCTILNNLDAAPPAFVPEHPFCFTIGPTIPKKNFHVLPRVLKNNRYDLVIAGYVDPAYSWKIIEEAERCGAADRVFIIGPVSENDKIWYYRNCSAFLFPSLAEGFGLPVVEAMMFGKPVFLSTSTSLPEIGGGFANYFDTFDPESMNKIFNEVMSVPLSTERTDEIRKHAESFTWEIAAEKYLRLYRECVGGLCR